MILRNLKPFINLSLICFIGGTGFIVLKINLKRQADVVLQYKKDLSDLNQQWKENKDIEINYKNFEKIFSKAQKSGLLQRMDRQKLKQTCDTLVQQPKIDLLTYEIGITDKKETAHFSYQQTYMTLTFENDQDADIYGFIDMLPSKLPGVIIPEQLSLNRMETMSTRGHITGTYHFYLINLDAPTCLK